MPVPTTPEPKPATVSKTTSSGTEAVLVLAANTHRAGGSIFNNGAQTEYLGTDDTVTTGTGYPVPSGTPFPDSLSTSAWWAVRGSGTADLRVVEVSTRA